MKIGEVAQKLNTTLRTLRYYEEQGLVRPPRTSGGTRRYNKDNLERFRAILQLTGIGIPVNTLRELAQTRATSHTGDQSSHRVDDLLSQLSEELNEQKRNIQRVERDLNQARKLVQQCFGCRQAPTRHGCSNCPVAANLNRARVLNLIWDEPDEEQ